VGGLDLFGGTAPASVDGAWTVADVTRRARQLMEAGFDRVWVRGEITGLKAYQSGHWYFTLRDATAQVRCVMWRMDHRRLPGPPDDGTEVFVEARPTVWEERGEFRLTVKTLLATAAGGLWQLSLERARAALERDGLLDTARKRPLPPYPRRIAVVTSPDGAALRDIVTVLRRRWPLVELLLVPSRVQGEGAEDDLCAALARVNRLDAIDLAIVGRGGGSREDLWAFNAERVARAVAAVRVPTISAVGHETDVALTDLVADVRAPTPSAAAEAAVPDRVAVREVLGGLARRLSRDLARQLEQAQTRLGRTWDRLAQGMDRHLERAARTLASVGAQLDALSPLRVLERGYAVARDDGGRVLSRVVQFVPGASFRLTVSDGDVRARTVEGG
jgi:exodeoxyribonuclease VII large subunit